MTLETIIDLDTHPINQAGFALACKSQLDQHGVVVLKDFLLPEAKAQMIAEAKAHQDQAFFTNSNHNVYLTPPDPSLPADHAFNRQVASSKGCICTDQVPMESPLHALYQSPDFKAFIAQVVGEPALYPYGDTVSGINVHFAPDGKELGWHFDNSEFAITLLLQKPEAGGEYQYIKDLRNANAGHMNFDEVAKALDGVTKPKTLDIDPGTLVLFRGRNSLHRVTPTIGETTRILVVLAYNAQPGIALSESARMTFFGRLGEERATP